MMHVTWLGQAGLLFENETITIMIDPYLSNSCGERNPKLSRRKPIDKNFFQIKPDIMICTHNHQDHLDIDTLKHFIGEDSGIVVMSSEDGYDSVHELGGNNTYVLLRPGTKWTYGGVTITAVSAEHSEPTAVGVIIDDGAKKYYVTGDTLYNERIFGELPKDIYAVFLPINGAGNNMNTEDAGYFAERTGAQAAVPLHWGLFDDIDPEEFHFINKRIPSFYQKIRW